MKNKKNLLFKLDSLGRVIIHDPDLLAVVSGAVQDRESILGDNGCHDNGGCGDAGCANGGC